MGPAPAAAGLASAKRPQAGRGRRSVAALLALAALWAALACGTPAAAAESSGAPATAARSEALDALLPLIGGALVDIGRGEHAAAEQAIGEARRQWAALGAPASDPAARVDAAFADAERAVKASADDPAAAKKALAALTSAIDAYRKAQRGNAPSGPQAAKSLLPQLDGLLAHVKAADWAGANADYRRLSSGWTKVEQAIRGDNAAVYGRIETSLSMLRIALQAEPPRAEQAQQEAQSLADTVRDYADGKLAGTDQGQGASGKEPAVTDLIAALDRAAAAIEAKRADEAEEAMQQFIRLWPSVEGQVSVRSPAVYGDIENRMTQVSSLLLATPPQYDQAAAQAARMKSELQPLAAEADQAYTAVDAGAVLLREGLEAILVLAALLAYLQRTGNESKRRWIWSGVGAGLLASGALALLLTYAVSKAASGGARETVEGVAGLASVALMLTVGNWLHGKANLKAWNAYIDRTMSAALKRGSLWSLLAVAALAIAREGAETTIFIIGMAPSIAPGQLALGIGAAFALLAVIGYAIVKLSAKLPIRPFFLTATALIYYLVFRFLGESIHALQVSGALPAHTAPAVPPIDALGVFPTWETLVPQLLLLAYIAGRLVMSRLRAARLSEARHAR
jgi:high-affinity iron transporter